MVSTDLGNREVMSIEKRLGYEFSRNISEAARILDQLQIRRKSRLVDRSSNSHGGGRKRNGKTVKVSFNERQWRGIDNK